MMILSSLFNEDYIHILLKCLTECANYYHEEINTYMNYIFSITSTIINFYVNKISSKNIDLSSFVVLVKQCYEIWINIGLIEKKAKVKNINCKYFYIATCESPLYELIFNTVFRRTKEEEEDLDNNDHVYNIACSLLEIMSKCSTDNIIVLVINHMNELIKSKNNKDKLTALLLFSCILPTTHKAKLVEIVNAGFNTIIEYISDSDTLISREASNIYKKISDNFFEELNG